MVNCAAMASKRSRALEQRNSSGFKNVVSDKSSEDCNETLALLFESGRPQYTEKIFGTFS